MSSGCWFAHWNIPLYAKKYRGQRIEYKFMHQTPIPVLQVIFLIGHLYLTGVWFGEDQRANNMKTHVYDKLDYIFIFLLTIPHSKVNIIGSTYVFSLGINKHALPITIPNHGRSNFQFDSCWCFVADLLMQHNFCCANRIGRSWRRWKTNRVAPTYLAIVIWWVPSNEPKFIVKDFILSLNLQIYMYN